MRKININTIIIPQYKCRDSPKRKTIFQCIFFFFDLLWVKLHIVDDMIFFPLKYFICITMHETFIANLIITFDFIKRKKNHRYTSNIFHFISNNETTNSDKIRSMFIFGVRFTHFSSMFYFTKLLLTKVLLYTFLELYVPWYIVNTPLTSSI